MSKTVTIEEITYKPLPEKFEAGTMDFAGIIAFGALIDYMERIGREAIAEYEEALLYHGEEKLRQIEGLHIIGTVPEKEPLTTFTLDGVDVAELDKYLNSEWGIAVKAGKLCAQPLLKFLRCRKSLTGILYVVNTKEEVDTLVEATETYRKNKA